MIERKKTQCELGKVKQLLIDKDVSSMLNSTTFHHYKTIKLHATQSQFFNVGLNWEATRLIQQLRAGIPHIKINGKSIILNSMWKIWTSKTFKTTKCELCGKEDEDIYHIMFSCPHYKAPRIKYLSKHTQIIQDKSEFPTKLFMHDHDKIYFTNLYYFWCEAIKTRIFHTEF